MSNRVLVAPTVTDIGHEISVDVDQATGYLTFDTIRSVVRVAPPRELRALERLWLFARGVVHHSYDFLPKHIDIERGRSDVARAWLRLDAARHRSRDADLAAIAATAEAVP